MTLEELTVKVRDWDFQYSGPIATSKYSIALAQLSYHATRDWRIYLPSEHSDFNPSYMERLAAWIGNVADEDDQKLLLEYAQYISFFSHHDFIAMYRTAMEREISRWLVSQIAATLEPNGLTPFDDLLKQQIHRQTWFCPITDSMDINEFYKVNHLRGIEHRPGFATLQMLAEGGATPDLEVAKNIRHYMSSSTPPLLRIVLLEDVVGSATQCLNAVRWAVANLGVPVLFVPLILCPNGTEAMRLQEANSNGQLTVRPVIELRRSDLLGPERQGENGWPITVNLEDLAIRSGLRAAQNMDTFGFRNTGCSVVTFANTPDNTLPLIHNKAQNGDWEPLFPRVFRN